MTTDYLCIYMCHNRVWDIILSTNCLVWLAKGHQTTIYFSKFVVYKDFLGLNVKEAKLFTRDYDNQCKKLLSMNKLLSFEKLKCLPTIATICRKKHFELNTTRHIVAIAQRAPNLWTLQIMWLLLIIIE